MTGRKRAARGQCKADRPGKAAHEPHPPRWSQATLDRRYAAGALPYHISEGAAVFSLKASLGVTQTFGLGQGACPGVRVGGPTPTIVKAHKPRMSGWRGRGCAPCNRPLKHRRGSVPKPRLVFGRLAGALGPLGWSDHGDHFEREGRSWPAGATRPRPVATDDAPDIGPGGALLA
jgi:hypothetical protein